MVAEMFFGIISTICALAFVAIAMVFGDTTLQMLALVSFGMFFGATVSLYLVEKDSKRTGVT